jgi:hypothetical protein
MYTSMTRRHKAGATTVELAGDDGGGDGAWERWLGRRRLGRRSGAASLGGDSGAQGGGGVGRDAQSPGGGGDDGLEREHRK